MVDALRSRSATAARIAEASRGSIPALQDRTKQARKGVGQRVVREGEKDVFRGENGGEPAFDHRFISVVSLAQHEPPRPRYGR